MIDLFDIKLVGSLVAVITLQGSILIAAAKSMFATRGELKEMLAVMAEDRKKVDRKLYNSHGLPIYTLRSEYVNESKEMERRNEILFNKQCVQIERLSAVIEKIREAQESMNILISQLQVRRKSD